MSDVRDIPADVLLGYICAPNSALLTSVIRDELKARFADLEAKLATADAIVTCCCGNPMTHSGYEGHSPVSQYHWHMHQLGERLDTSRTDTINECIQALETNWTVADPVIRLRGLLK